MARHKWLLLFLFFPFFPLSAMLIGNAGQPALQTDGIFQSPPSWWSFRVSYLDDWVYKQRFMDQYKIDDCTSTATFVKISTYAAQVILNFTNRIDLYTLLGASRLQIDEEIFTKRRFAWGVGTKFVIFQEGNFRIGGDLKYFETSQKPTFFICEDLAYNVVTSDFRLKYQETQGALGASYVIWLFAPYVHATYIMTKIEPDPSIALVRLPEMDLLVDVDSKSVTSKKRWGMALGLTLIDKAKATLAFEWRLFNQNAIDVNAEIRF